MIVLDVGVPFAYIHFVEGSQPGALTLSDTDRDGDGGHRFRGRHLDHRHRRAIACTRRSPARARPVGRTTQIASSLTVTGAEVTAANFTVQMATVTSDRSQRDQQFAGRIMDTAQYLTGTFPLTKPSQLGSVPAVGAQTSETITRELTLHGTTKLVTFTAHAERTSTQLNVVGSIDIAYADYGIDNPSFGGVVSVGNRSRSSSCW